MRARTVLFLLAQGIVVSIMFGCTVSHQTMRGSILATYKDKADICIGRDDGIRVGDILTVFEINLDNKWQGPEYDQRFPTAEYLRMPKYRKVKAGGVRVIRIFDEHFAEVQLVSGELESNSIVEKSPRREEP